jgi:hypothetical protein
MPCQRDGSAGRMILGPAYLSSTPRFYKQSDWLYICSSYRLARLRLHIAYEQLGLAERGDWKTAMSQSAPGAARSLHGKRLPTPRPLSWLGSDWSRTMCCAPKRAMRRLYSRDRLQTTSPHLNLHTRNNRRDRQLHVPYAGVCVRPAGTEV